MLEFMVRVRLPDSAAYHSSPSGDSDYQEAYDKALKDAVPAGFSVVKLRPGQHLPKDSEGFTYVRLQLDDPSTAVWSFKERAEKAEGQLRAVRKVLENVMQTALNSLS